MPTSSTWLLSLKLIFISTIVLSLATFIAYTLPSFLDEVPAMWSTFVSWLKPPYLYLVINLIIITIAASSLFTSNLEHDEGSNQSKPLIVSSDLRSDFVSGSAQTEFGGVVDNAQVVVYEPEVKALDVKPVLVDDQDNSFVISRSTWTPPHRNISMETQPEVISPVTEKPLVSSRIGHRKPVRASPEGGRALKVSRPKKQETLENTWKTLTDRRHVPLTRHLKKSETFENHGSHMSSTTLDYSPQRMKKSETLKDRTNYDPVTSLSPSPNSGKIVRVTSPSQDELNRRVEAFIKKFNEEMRLQRQESLNQYTEMINRGSH